MAYQAYAEDLLHTHWYLLIAFAICSNKMVPGRPLPSFHAWSCVSLPSQDCSLSPHPWSGKRCMPLAIGRTRAPEGSLRLCVQRQLHDWGAFTTRILTTPGPYSLHDNLGTQCLDGSWSLIHRSFRCCSAGTWGCWGLAYVLHVSQLATRQGPAGIGLTARATDRYQWDRPSPDSNWWHRTLLF